MRRKPTVLTKCVANHYTNENERIIEFNDREQNDCGGLISFRRIGKQLKVTIYNYDKNVMPCIQERS